MADYLREELDKLLNEYDQKRSEVLAREAKVKEEDARFVARFAELRRGVIRPAFERAAAILAERGHRVSISEEEFAVDTASKVVEAGIFIHLVPAGTQSTVRDEKGRALSISTRHYNKTVSINTGKPLEVSKGTYRLEQIDRDFIEQELVKFVAGVVAG